MKTTEQAIKTLNDRVNEYYKMKSLDGHRLNELLRDITGLLYYLESVRSDVHTEYEMHINFKVNEGNSVARAVNEANCEFPALYRLRRLMEASYEVVGAIRTNISYLKQELNQNI